MHHTNSKLDTPKPGQGQNKSAEMMCNAIIVPMIRFSS
jgi:hypothetical protein